MHADIMLSLGDPLLGEPEKRALCSVIDSGWLTMGEQVARFERAFAGLHRMNDAVAVSSCTAALHLGLAALDIGPGDEVLVPSLTFVATVNAVLYVGATPVFVDIVRPELPHISLEDADAKCTPRTRAVVVMHYAGYPVDLAAWRAFADERGLMLIEDAAHAPAVDEVGRWGDVSAFSFFANKNMTTAEGGMVLARNAALLQHIRYLRSHGMTTSTLDRNRGHAHSYDVVGLGYNYRLDELRAAMGLAQLFRVPHWNARRRALTDRYRSVLADLIPELAIPFDPGRDSAAHLMPILLPGDVHRESTMSRLHQAGIQSSIHYPPVHRFSYYRERFPGVVLPNTEQFSTRELSLPLHPGLGDDDVDRVAGVLAHVISSERTPCANELSI
jgi:dTDP-4-amino-4,6-dideoxygalactose transaminase